MSAIVTRSPGAFSEISPCANRSNRGTTSSATISRIRVVTASVLSTVTFRLVRGRGGDLQTTQSSQSDQILRQRRTKLFAQGPGSVAAEVNPRDGIHFAG